ncbi:hypothetical protein [uncultured Flavobacterium sp.]|uniref:Dyp-type peroxidase n=1 Tax=uncultured Flavobacterium sp. TaxID=165435 RepID=UPI0025CD1E54|nr:hypothetical protein [uncultured Flavobacterium sp.]
MALSLNQTGVNGDAKFAKMLNSVQSNILKGHGRNFAHHLLFQLDASKAEDAKAWIAGFADKFITSAAGQLAGTRAFREGKTTDAGPVFTLSLTSKGYDILGLESAKPANSSFNNGMKEAVLGDDPGNFEPPFLQDIHMLILVADDCTEDCLASVNAIVAEVSGFAKLILNQRGNVLKIKGGTGIEHFGYADGISQPIYFEKDIKEQVSTTQWNDATNLDRLLVEDPGAETEDCFGSFLVFRKLEQNVKAFKTAEQTGLPIIKNVDGRDNEELAGAMLVGRFESGVPVVKSSIDNIANPKAPSNDFDYSNDMDAIKCPFHSHVRLMNPRNGDRIAGNQDLHRITRRGMPYDEIGRIDEKDIENITDEMLNSSWPEKGVGLLFFCYQSNIGNQFEILQQFWANMGNIAGHLVGGEDSLISQGANPVKTLPQQWGGAKQTDPFAFGNFVTTRGGEYFFTPSIDFLKSLSATL